MGFMGKSYKGVLDQYARMVEFVRKNGRARLEAYFEHSDWMLLVTNRIVLEEGDLSPEDRQVLEELDQVITEHFTPSLFNEYQTDREKMLRWWGSDN